MNFFLFEIQILSMLWVFSPRLRPDILIYHYYLLKDLFYLKVYISVCLWPSNFVLFQDILVISRLFVFPHKIGSFIVATQKQVWDWAWEWAEGISCLWVSVCPYVTCIFWRDGRCFDNSESSRCMVLFRAISAYLIVTRYEIPWNRHFSCWINICGLPLLKDGLPDRHVPGPVTVF